MKSNFIFMLLLILSSPIKSDTIFVKPAFEDNTSLLQEAINEAKLRKGKPTVIKLEQANYRLSREHASKNIYHVSNTIDGKSHVDATKHIGLWIKGMKNVTIDGGGALLITHGKMTSFVIDSCENITLTNFSVTADDPTVVEMKVVEVGDDFLITKPHVSARYEINNGKLKWFGHGWTLDGGIAQIYDIETNYSHRCSSPMSGLKHAQELKNGLLRLDYDKAPRVKLGQIYQLRDGIRDEVAGLIIKSKNITLSNMRYHFLGNFGIVGQYSENITYEHLICEPELGSGRTCAGFADFIQMSGCKGLVKIKNCRFEGAQDDPINIHGTHLEVVKHPSEKQIVVKFMHPESFGFEAFFRGDKIEFVDSNSLLCVQKTKVKKATRLSDREILLDIEDALEPSIKNIEKLVVENTTWTPKIEISNCYFSRIPTRGILVTTRGDVSITNNTFFRTPMSAILIANDGRSWYESGPVHNVTIKGNHFIECGSPVINIHPENSVHKGHIHKNIRIEGNRFQLNNKEAIYAKSVLGLIIKNNLFINNEGKVENDFINTDNSDDLAIDNNKIIIR